MLKKQALSLLLLLFSANFATIDLVANDTSVMIDNDQELRSQYESFKTNVMPNALDLKQYLVDQKSFPILYEMVVQAAKDMGLDHPQIFITNDNGFNAACTQVAPTLPLYVMINGGVLSDVDYNLNYNEIKAVIYHEMAHVKHEHVKKRSALVSKIMPIGMGLSGVNYLFKEFVAPGLYQKLNIKDQQFKILGKEFAFNTKYQWLSTSIGIGVGYVVIFAFVLKLLKQCRAEEKEADLTAISFTKDPISLINALEKLELANKKRYPNYGKGPDLFRTHPAKTEREAYLKELIVS